VALLYGLHHLRPRLDFALTAVHLNHGLRGAESDADAEFVQVLAWHLGIPCVVEKVNVGRLAREGRISVEMAGRSARQQLFIRSARQVGADRVATAHHADDQVETLLLRLLRGTSLQGLGGMRHQSVRDGLCLIRPMLDIRHAEAVLFLKAHGLAWREDASNADSALLRNRIRHELLPFLEERFQPAVRANLLRTARVVRDEQDWLDELSVTLGRGCRTAAGGLREASLIRLPLAARRRILLKWLIEQGIPAGRLDVALLDRIEGWLTSRARRLSLPGRLHLERVGPLLCLRDVASAASTAFECTLEVPGRVAVPGVGLVLQAEIDQGFKKTHPGQLLAWISDARRAGASLVIRSRRPGDRMRPHGLNGSVKVQDVLVDLKVPRAERDRIPVVTCRDEIIWVPGYRIARGWDVPGMGAPSVRMKVIPGTGSALQSPAAMVR
jgi:tRNA(Ile)-lysidine synthase